MLTATTRQRARKLIEAGDQRWFDFCAEHGHLPANVQRLRGISQEFADWLEDNA